MLIGSNDFRLNAYMDVRRTVRVRLGEIGVAFVEILSKLCWHRTCNCDLGKRVKQFSDTNKIDGTIDFTGGSRPNASTFRSFVNITLPAAARGMLVIQTYLNRSDKDIF